MPRPRHSPPPVSSSGASPKPIAMTPGRRHAHRGRLRRTRRRLDQSRRTRHHRPQDAVSAKCAPTSKKHGRTAHRLHPGGDLQPRVCRIARPADSQFYERRAPDATAHRRGTLQRGEARHFLRLGDNRIWTIVHAGQPHVRQDRDLDAARLHAAQHHAPRRARQTAATSPRRFVVERLSAVPSPRVANLGVEAFSPEMTGGPAGLRCPPHNRLSCATRAPVRLAGIRGRRTKPPFARPSPTTGRRWGS